MDYEKSHIAPYGKFLVKIWKEVTNITFGVIFYCFFCFFSKFIYLLQVVATEVFPVVVGGTIGMDGQTGFLFVQ